MPTHKYKPECLCWKCVKTRTIQEKLLSGELVKTDTGRLVPSQPPLQDILRKAE